MEAFKATPKLPWDISEGGLIKLRNTMLTMDELLAGRLTFKVRNGQGNIVDGTVVRYTSDQKYYVQADGSLLWQVQAIEHSSNTVILSPSENITSGFSLVDVEITPIGAFLREYNGRKYVVDASGKILLIAANPQQALLYGLALSTQSSYNLFDIASIDEASPMLAWGVLTISSGSDPSVLTTMTVGEITYSMQFNEVYSVSPEIKKIFA
jgi:hypothetical protein